jgi:hypothetical protein
MSQPILEEMAAREILSAADTEKIRAAESGRLFSLHWELKTMLYFGVLLMNVGLGFLIYQHINSIGHLTILAVIALACGLCFWYAWKHQKPFSLGEVDSATPYFDYILLLGCLLFLVLEGYLQYQYRIFGERYGLVSFIPMVLFFFLGYRLDNRAVLSLGISALATWLGITVTPHELLKNNDFHSETIIQTGIALGFFLSVVPFVMEKYGIKKHFSLTYLNFGIHLLMVSALSGMMALDKTWWYLPPLLAGLVFYLWYARQNESFYFFTASIIYGYIGLCTVVLRNWAEGWWTEHYTLYFICTGSIMAYLLIQNKHFIQSKQP